jgi:hypothetical protein
VAGDWIKMRCALMHDPKVIAIGRFIQAQPGFAEWLSSGAISEMPLCDTALRYIVTGALHVTWSVTNEHAKNGAIEGASLEWIDLVTGIRGFGEAMQEAGWARLDDDRLVFPKFDANNTSSAERVRKWREKQRQKCNVTETRYGSATCNVTVTQEKRREDKSKETKGKKAFHPPTLAEVSAYCRERKNGIDPQAFIDHYTAKGWVVGKSPMKDWQAAVRTWEKNRAANPTASPLKFLD